MLSALFASLLVSWIAIVVLALTVIALARQVGILHERIAPLGALKVDRGPAVGDAAPVFSLLALDQRPVRIGTVPSGFRAQLLLFVSPDCPVCKKLMPIAKSFVTRERLELVFVGDGDAQEHRRMIERFGLEAFAFVNDADVGIRYGVGKLPYAVLIDDRGVIASSGLVNSREHLESLVVAHESGFRSVQDYLRHLRRPEGHEPAETRAGEQVSG